jgi:short-subunit dehydrogenase
VSAAGLLTMLGSAPYSATKHAALAYSEWLSATYGRHGIVVQCLCPQGVRTRMLEGTGAAGDVLLRAGALEPEQVAEALWEGLQDDRFLVLPHPEVHDYYAARASDTDRWLAGMRRLQDSIDARSSV